MAREFPTSASQDRMISLFGLTCDGTTAHAQAVLTAAGLPSNGIPVGLTPQKAKKLTDAEIVAMFPSANTATAVETATAEVEKARAESARRHGEYLDSINAWKRGPVARPARTYTDEEDADIAARSRIGYSDMDSDSRYDDRGE